MGWHRPGIVTDLGSQSWKDWAGRLLAFGQRTGGWIVAVVSKN